MTFLTNQTLAEIVTRDHRTAAVLEKYQLDFCCKGKRSLTQACKEKGLSPVLLDEELQRAITNTNTSGISFHEMTLTALIDYIVINHHTFVRNTLPQIKLHLEKVAAKHGQRFPAMKEVFALFTKLDTELLQHLEKEELVLFPAIRKMELEVTANGIKPDKLIVSAAIHLMESEHDEAGSIMARISKLTNAYQAPAEACNTFRLSLNELKSFESDLHRHVHLENNILFPKAVLQSARISGIA